MTRLKKIFWNCLKSAGLAVSGLLALLFILPVLFPGTVAEQIKTWTNESIEGKLEFSKTSLSFFDHFPSLTLTLHDFPLTGAAPFSNDTLLAGKSLAFSLDLASLFGETLEVNTFFIDDARINVQVDEKGRANYNVYKGSSDTTQSGSNTRIKLAGIFFQRCQLTYNDRSIPLLIEAKDFYYEGRGDLADSQFDLQSNMRAARLRFCIRRHALFPAPETQGRTAHGYQHVVPCIQICQKRPAHQQTARRFFREHGHSQRRYDIDLNVVSGTTDFGNIFPPCRPNMTAGFQKPVSAASRKSKWR